MQLAVTVRLSLAPVPGVTSYVQVSVVSYVTASA